MKVDLTQFEGMTDGQWFVHDFREASSKPTVNDIHVSCTTPDHIGVCSMERALTATEKEALANARAIAALPDLIAELKRTRAALDIAREYFYERQDVNWEGTAGNDAMKCLQEINEALGER